MSQGSGAGGQESAGEGASARVAGAGPESAAADGALAGASAAPPAPATRSVLPPQGGTPTIGWPGVLWRIAATAILVGGYYWMREPLRNSINGLYARIVGDDWTHSWLVPVQNSLDWTTTNAIGVIAMLAALIIVWRKIVLRDPRFHAPLLATTILLLGDATYSILDSLPAPPWLVSLTAGVVRGYSPAVVAIVVAILAEAFIGRFFWGKWPHLASGYVTGISVGILIKSPELWPYVVCALVSILSKYVLRAGNRHLWNPSNFGVTMMLFLAPAATLTFQAGNNGLAVAAVWVMGGLIMLKIRRFHIPAAFVLTWIPLAFLRAAITGDPWQAEIAPITSPMFQLYIFFMITDPKTTTKYRWSQTLVAILIAVVETSLRLAFKDIHSLYHALFIVAPTTNLMEIWLLARQSKLARSVAQAAVSSTPLEPAATR